MQGAPAWHIWGVSWSCQWDALPSGHARMLNCNAVPMSYSPRWLAEIRNRKSCAVLQIWDLSSRESVGDPGKDTSSESSVVLEYCSTDGQEVIAVSQENKGIENCCFSLFQNNANNFICGSLFCLLSDLAFTVSQYYCNVI